MLTKEDLLAIGQIMDEKLKPIKETLDQHSESISLIKDDISDIKEQLKEMDASIGMIAEWAEKVAEKEKIPFASGNLAI